MTNLDDVQSKLSKNYCLVRKLKFEAQKNGKNSIQDKIYNDVIKKMQEHVTDSPKHHFHTDNFKYKLCEGKTKGENL